MMEMAEDRKQVLGKDHHDTLTSLSALELKYSKHQQWAESEAALLEAIKGRKYDIGKDQVHTLSSIEILSVTRLLSRPLVEVGSARTRGA